MKGQLDFDFDPFGSSKKKRDSRRRFTRTQKNEILAQQNNKCAKCHKPLDMRTVEFDHKKPWSEGGKTKLTNGRALCPHCHKLATHKHRLKKVENRKKKSNNPFEIELYEPSLDF